MNESAEWKRGGKVEQSISRRRSENQATQRLLVLPSQQYKKKQTIAAPSNRVTHTHGARDGLRENTRKVGAD